MTSIGILRSVCLLLMAFQMFFSGTDAQGADRIKSDERILFFPAVGVEDPNTGRWTAELHGWIYEPETDDVARRAMLATLKGLIDPKRTWTEEVDRRLTDRARLFVVDNERGKRVGIRIAGENATLLPSAVDGHFFGTVELAPKRVKAHATNGLITYAAENTGEVVYDGLVRLLPATGLTVISDIDDTIKVSEVLDRRRLMARTFLEEYEAVPGMSGLYRKLEERGAAFHYLSASPWQLFPSLEAFRSREKFPTGMWTLKRVRLKDESLLELLASPEEYKIPLIEEAVKRFPKRQFLLIGDDGERDPEVYGEIARRHPEQIKGIWIRQVAPSEAADARYSKAFRDLPDTLRKRFESAKDLLPELDRVAPKTAFPDAR